MKDFESPFDKIDIAGWHSIDDMKKENCLDMIEYSKATDSKFMVNQDISREYTELIRDKALIGLIVLLLSLVYFINMIISSKNW
jgi:hypothetical protein